MDRIKSLMVVATVLIFSLPVYAMYFLITGLIDDISLSIAWGLFCVSIMGIILLRISLIGKSISKRL